MLGKLNFSPKYVMRYTFYKPYSAVSNLSMYNFLWNSLKSKRCHFYYQKHILTSLSYHSSECFCKGLILSDHTKHQRYPRLIRLSRIT